MNKKRKNILIILLFLLIFAFSSIGLSNLAHHSLTVSSLRILDYYEQMGIDTRTPEFSWKLSCNRNGAKQTAYQILVADDENDLKHNRGTIWDSSKQISEQVYGIQYSGDLLNSNTEYYWKVRVWDEQNKASKWSDTKKFVTGFLESSDWEAEWIGNGSLKPFYARKVESILNKKIKSAYAFVSGLGQFKFYINGEKVGDHELDPGWTDYNKKIQYVTFDIKDLLVAGENAFAISIGNGWYSKDTGDRHFYIDYPDYGTMLPTIAEIHITYVDGTNQKIVTDTSWHTRSSATTIANVFGSEDFDARLYPEGWNTVEFNETEDKTAEPWTKAKKVLDCNQDLLSAMTQPPVKTKKVYDTVNIVEYDGKLLFDLGQNMSGMFEIFAKGPANSRIKVMPVEKLTDGKAEYTVNTFSYYTLKGTGKIEVFKPDFSYTGARWVEISIEDSSSATSLTRNEDESNQKVYIQDVKGHFITSSADDTGNIKTSDGRYEQVSELINKATESNLLHIHTDCPTIEKLGWLETTHLMQNGISYTKDTRELWQKIIADTREAQNDEGKIPTVVPAYNGHIFDNYFGDSPVWSATNVLSTYYNYMNYGDKKTIQENFESMRKLLSYTKSKLNKDGFLIHGLGDWGSPRYNTNDVNAINLVDPANIDTAYYYYELTVMAEMCTIIGQQKLAQEYQNDAALVKENYNNHLLVLEEKSGNYYYERYDTSVPVVTGDTIIQANQAVALYFNIVPEEYKSDVFQAMISDIEKNGITSGEVALKPIIQVLKQYGRYDIIDTLITDSEHPSYYRFIENGETTLPEFWTDTARSRNHDMMGTIQQYFYDGVGGITALEPGYKKIKIQPGVVNSIMSATVEYDSIRGRILSDWKIDENGLMLNVLIPPGTTGKVYMSTLDYDKFFVLENEIIIYQNGSAKNQNEAIKFDTLVKDESGNQYLVFDILSGYYSFKLEGEK